jgi:hypothetical protein
MKIEQEIHKYSINFYLVKKLAMRASRGAEVFRLRSKNGSIAVFIAIPGPGIGLRY